MAKPPSRSITAPLGFTAAATTAGIKRSGRPDLAVIVSDRPCVAAGVFTTSRTPAPPIAVNRRHLAKSGASRARAVVVNSGNANAATGAAGERDAETMCDQVAEGLTSLEGAAVGRSQVLVASTGIIGRPLPMDKIGRGIATLVSKLARGPGVDADAARAILTTDLIPKPAYRELKLGGKTVRLGGIAKGSGMIAPNMATMLAFVTTDAAISAPLLRKALTAATAASFNRISVDQHTSPSDALIALANGAAGNRPITAGAPGAGTAYGAFLKALTDLCRDLAYQVVKDGEGATKVFRVLVEGAKDEKEADRVGRAVVDSPLVKCAVHGADPNWGRIVTAAGYSGAAIDPDRMSLDIAPVGGRVADRPIRVFAAGQPVALTLASKRRLNTIMKGKEVRFTLALGRGRAAVEWLGCDLSKQYVTINADYTT